MRGLRGLMAMSSLSMLLLGMVGCSSDTGPDDDGNGNQSTLSGTINGSAWAAVTPLAARSGSTTVTVSVFGSDAQQRAVSVTIVGATGAGTYLAGQGEAAVVSLDIGSQVWPGFVAGSTGSVVITTLTTTHMIGTFNVTLQPLTSTGASGTRTVIGSFTAYFGQT